MKRIHLIGRVVDQITSEEGQAHYYDKMNYWRVCFANTNPLCIPGIEDANEYLCLRKIKDLLWSKSSTEDRLRLRKLQIYETRYDWRPYKSMANSFIGLVSPTGKQILPEAFSDVFTQFDAIDKLPDFIPVSNGKAWALISLSASPVLVTEFCYKMIIPERWESRLFFVQNKATMKWGALSIIWPFTNVSSRRDCTFPCIKHIMPCIADEIYEDELMTEESPTIFFMTRVGKKFGILTDFGYSEIIYDSYETDDEEYSFRLICKDCKRAHHVDFWHPDGK